MKTTDARGNDISDRLHTANLRINELQAQILKEKALNAQLTDELHSTMSKLRAFEMEYTRVQIDQQLYYNSLTYRLTTPPRQLYWTIKKFLASFRSASRNISSRLSGKIKKIIIVIVLSLKSNPWADRTTTVIKKLFPNLWQKTAIRVKSYVQPKIQREKISRSNCTAEEKHFIDLFERELAKRTSGKVNN